MDDGQLLLRTSRGDEAAARALWDLHGPALLAYARAILGASMRHEAEDIVQSVMCSILRTPARRLREVREPGRWLSTMTRRLALNTLRAAGRQKRRAALRPAEATFSDGGHEAPGLPAGPMRATCPAENIPALGAALDQLPRKLREVVYLKHVASLSFDQMALSLSRSRSTLSTQYQSALTRLRDILGATDPARLAAREHLP